MTEHPDYSLPRVINYLQLEWKRFERQRTTWELERLNMQKRITELEAELSASLNIKQDLLTRIKMLEWALREERKKNVLAKGMPQPPPRPARTPMRPRAAHLSSTPGPSMSASLPAFALTPGSSPVTGAKESLTASLRRSPRSKAILMQFLSNYRYSSLVSTPLAASSLPPDAPPCASAPAPLVHSPPMPAPPVLVSKAPALPHMPFALPYRRPRDILSYQPADNAGPAAGDRQDDEDSMNPLLPPSPHNDAARVDPFVPVSTLRPPSPTLPPSASPSASDLLASPASPLSAPAAGSIDVSRILASVSPRGAGHKTRPRPRGKAPVGEDEGEDEMAGISVVSEHDVPEGPASVANERDVLEGAFEGDAQCEAGEGADADASTAPLHASGAPERPCGSPPPPSEGLVGFLQSSTGPGAADDDSCLDSTASPRKRLDHPRFTGRTFKEWLHQTSLTDLSAPEGGGDDKALPIDDAPPDAGLGELADVTLHVEDAAPKTVAAPTPAVRHRYRHSLLSHLDGVRCVRFHPTDTALVSASEDGSVKWWRLQNLLPSSSKSLGDIEPTMTMRGHLGPVLTCTLAPERNLVISGGIDSTVRLWRVPSGTADPYGQYGCALPQRYDTYAYHSDAVWSVAMHPYLGLLASASADGTTKVFNIDQRSPLQHSLRRELESGTYDIPTAVAFTPDSDQLAVGYKSGITVLYDATTFHESTVLPGDAQPTTCTTPAALEGTHLTALAVHPTLNLLVTAHANHVVRLYDTASGECVHSMIGHPGAVTCVDISPSGCYFMTGGQDCSVRFWDVRTRSCVQEIATHRKRFDEGIHTVAYHPSGPLLASGGADSHIKIFV